MLQLLFETAAEGEGEVIPRVKVGDGRTDGSLYFFPISRSHLPNIFKKKSTRISLLFVREIDALSRAKQNIQLHRRRQKKAPKTGLKDIAAPSANRGTTQNKEETAQFEYFQGKTQPRQNIFHRIFKGCDFCFFRTNKERRICVHELHTKRREREDTENEQQQRDNIITKSISYVHTSSTE